MRRHVGRWTRLRHYLWLAFQDPDILTDMETATELVVAESMYHAMHSISTEVDTQQAAQEAANWLVRIPAIEQAAISVKALNPQQAISLGKVWWFKFIWEHANRLVSVEPIESIPEKPPIDSSIHIDIGDQ